MEVLINQQKPIYVYLMKLYFKCLKGLHLKELIPWGKKK